MLYTISLKQNKEFRTLYYHGKFKASPRVVTYIRKNRLHTCRIGITAGKKVGNAVKRNRARRIIKAAFAKIEQNNDLRGYDFVFVARSQAIGVKSTAIEKDLKKHIAAITGLSMFS